MSRSETCDHCGKPAVVHEVVIRNGVTSEVHLCADHAREAGYALPKPPPVTTLLTHMLSAGGGAPQGEPAACQPTSGARRAQPCCSGCGLSFADFRRAGVLGCAACYETFGPALATLIERTQSAGAHHIGKVPRRGGGDIDRAMLRQRLVRELEEAVRAEQYERAAQLRDRILSLPDEVGSGARVADGPCGG